MAVGIEWLIEAEGCNPQALTEPMVLRSIFASVIADLGLNVLHCFWHAFPAPGGITGFAALTESHLACHTYPEYGMATFNLYCCRERPQWDWESNLSATLSARKVRIIRIERGTAEYAFTANALAEGQR
jgi:S-adenosylmethionine decarboxylase